MSDGTWTRHNLLNPRTVKRSQTITLKERLMLLFVRPKYSYDWDTSISTITKYKVMNGVIFVLNVKRRVKS